MVVVFGSNSYNVEHYTLTSSELDLFIKADGVTVDELTTNAAGQSEISIKDDSDNVVETVLNFTTIKGTISSLPCATEDGNIDCYKVTLVRGTTLNQDVLTNKANIEYIAALSNIEL